jgi:hypothetical protein
MKPESVKRIVDAYLEIFEEFSAKTFKQGLAFVMDTMEERFNAVKQIRTRQGLEAMLLKQPEPEPFVLDAQVESIRLLPYTVRKGRNSAI